MPAPNPPSYPDDAMFASGPAVDVEVGHGIPADPTSRRSTRVNDGHLPDMGTPPPRRRSHSQRNGGNFRTVEDFNGLTVRPGWHPGAEPGVDPAKSDGGHSSMPYLAAPCDITVIDFCERDIAIRHLKNDTLAPFLHIPQPRWSTCRWINVNGLSWDVIKILGAQKKLHRLAVEDIMNTRNRTKADWYPNHAFIVLTLQKLVHISERSDSEEDDEDSEPIDSQSVHRPAGLRRRFQRALGMRADGRRGAGKEGVEHQVTRDSTLDADTKSAAITRTSSSRRPAMRTLQRYHGQANDPRAKFMEQHSALASRDLAVAAEQVSIFILDDNTIISFFETSAEDVAKPIVRRLQTYDTILRQSCDASMIGQSIIDAIIDLAIPVASCYSDVVADLELDVLTKPDITHTKRLYIITTEINKMVSFITPIISLINALRDHKTNLAQDVAAKELKNPQKGVIITPMTYTYLGDVLDHCILITESLDQVRKSADGMIDLIFNTISALQNESMKQLTVATIIFLPLTFLTGYFGMNFDRFTDLTRGVSFFWMIAAPVVVGTIVILLSPTLLGSGRSLVQRYHIGKLRRLRRSRPKKAAGW